MTIDKVKMQLEKFKMHNLMFVNVGCVAEYHCGDVIADVITSGFVAL
jgi:hypothetical protein